MKNHIEEKIEEKKEKEEEFNTNKVNTSNIFDDFEVSDEIKRELEDEQKKDFMYYIDKIGKIFKYINFIFIIVLFLLGFYIFIEQSDKVNGFADHKDYLNPVCNILTGDEQLLYADYWNKDCSSITLVSSEIQEKIINKKKELLKITIDLLKNAYKENNINTSPEIIFIIDKYNSKMKIKMILSEFDKLKNKFSGVLASRISCDKLNIKDNILNTTCYVYSRPWEPEVPGENINDSSKKLEGTSISYAASFINFLQKEGTFSIINKQKTFLAEPYFGDGRFDYKTTIKLQLKYNKGNKNL